MDIAFYKFSSISLVRVYQRNQETFLSIHTTYWPMAIDWGHLRIFLCYSA